MSATEQGWQITDVNQIPAVKPDWPVTWKSVRHHFGITAFGINAVTKDAGNVLIPDHDESSSDQQEIYFVHRGAVKVTLDGVEHVAAEGSMIAVMPQTSRKLESTASPTTVIVIGGTPGQAYQVGEWEK